jgi:hypothetical protein
MRVIITTIVIAAACAAAGARARVLPSEAVGGGDSLRRDPVARASWQVH